MQDWYHIVCWHCCHPNSHSAANSRVPLCFLSASEFVYFPSQRDIGAMTGTRPPVLSAGPILQNLSSSFRFLLCLVRQSIHMQLLSSSFKFLLLPRQADILLLCSCFCLIRQSIHMQPLSSCPQLHHALQSILTGESSSVEKYMESTQSRKAVYQDKTCLLFAVRLCLLSLHVIPCQVLSSIACYHLKLCSSSSAAAVSQLHHTHHIFSGPSCSHRTASKPSHVCPQMSCQA